MAEINKRIFPRPLLFVPLKNFSKIFALVTVTRLDFRLRERRKRGRGGGGEGG